MPDNAHDDSGVLAQDRQRPRFDALSARGAAGLWALRLIVILVSLMVIYTFIHQLR
jgi:hypothetical protein